MRELRLKLKGVGNSPTSSSNNFTSSALYVLFLTSLFVTF